MDFGERGVQIAEPRRQGKLWICSVPRERPMEARHWPLPTADISGKFLIETK